MIYFLSLYALPNGTRPIGAHNAVRVLGPTWSRYATTAYTAHQLAASKLPSLDFLTKPDHARGISEKQRAQMDAVQDSMSWSGIGH